MRSKNTISFLLMLIWLPSFSQTKKFVEDFSLQNVSDNKNYSLSNFSNSKGILVIFNSSRCPYSLYYDSRIKTLFQKYSDKSISFLMINSNFGNRVSSEDLNAIKSQARSFNFPYLIDDSQDALTKFEARKNPEVFLLKPESGKFSVFYRGAIDDNPQVEHDVRNAYLENAIEQFLSGKNANPGVTNPSGCIIKK